MSYNVKWGRCLECDGFIRGDFNFCQSCKEPTEQGQIYLRKRKADRMSMEFKAKQSKSLIFICLFILLIRFFFK
jgi:hypothetical protein